MTDQLIKRSKSDLRKLRWEDRNTYLEAGGTYHVGTFGHDGPVVIGRYGKGPKPIILLDPRQFMGAISSNGPLTLNDVTARQSGKLDGYMVRTEKGADVKIQGVDAIDGGFLFGHDGEVWVKDSSVTGKRKQYGFFIHGGCDLTTVNLKIIADARSEALYRQPGGKSHHTNPYFEDVGRSTNTNATARFQGVDVTIIDGTIIGEFEFGQMYKSGPRPDGKNMDPRQDCNAVCHGTHFEGFGKVNPGCTLTLDNHWIRQKGGGGIGWAGRSSYTPPGKSGDKWKRPASKIIIVGGGGETVNPKPTTEVLAKGGDIEFMQAPQPPQSPGTPNNPNAGWPTWLGKRIGN